MESLELMVREMNNIPVMKSEDCTFLQTHGQHLGQVMLKTHMWRTDIQKRSIINDSQFPTLHAKFHQAILEQKVQLDQAFYLAKDFEEKRLAVEELLLDIEDLEKEEMEPRRKEIKLKKLNLDLKFKQYELSQARIAMDYRMAEVKGWQEIEDGLIKAMKDLGMTDEIIWNKTAGEVEGMFFLFLNKLIGVKQSTDSAEVDNLVSLALFAVKQAKDLGVYDNLLQRCSPLQLQSLKMLGVEK